MQKTLKRDSLFLKFDLAGISGRVPDSKFIMGIYLSFCNFTTVIDARSSQVTSAKFEVRVML